MASDIHNQPQWYRWPSRFYIYISLWLVMCIAGHHGFLFIYHCGWLCISLAITVLYLYIIVVGYVYRWSSRFYIYISLWFKYKTVMASDTHNRPQWYINIKPWWPAIHITNHNRWSSRFYIYISLWLVMYIAGHHGFIFIYHCGWLCVSLVITVLYTHNRPQWYINIKPWWPAIHITNHNDI
jgi:hypothetical protein